MRLAVGVIGALLILSAVASIPGVQAMGAPCNGVDLYGATILDATITYQNPSGQNTTVNLMQTPNATLDIPFTNNASGLHEAPYSSNVTIRSDAKPYLSNPGLTTGGIDYGGLNGNYAYTYCLIPATGSTVYTGLTIAIFHPASPVPSSSIDYCIGTEDCGNGSNNSTESVSFTVDWINETAATTSSTVTTHSTSSNVTTAADPPTTTATSTYAAPEFPVAAAPVILIAVLAVAVAIGRRQTIAPPASA